MTEEIRRLLNESKQMQGMGTGTTSIAMAVQAHALATLEVAKELAAIRQLLAESKELPPHADFDLMRALSK